MHRTSDSIPIKWRMRKLEIGERRVTHNENQFKRCSGRIYNSCQANFSGEQKYSLQDATTRMINGFECLPFASLDNEIDYEI